MINLLPNENKIANKKDYLRRLFTVAGVFSFIIITVSLILFLPAFFSLFFEGRDLAAQLAVLKEGDASVGTKNVYSDLNDLNSKLSFYEKNKDEVVISVLIAKIVSLKTNGVKINYFKYEKDKNARIMINGKSANRSDLINFKKKLEDDESFSSISSPLSNLLKDTDINFNMTIEL